VVAWELSWPTKLLFGVQEIDDIAFGVEELEPIDISHPVRQLVRREFDVNGGFGDGNDRL